MRINTLFEASKYYEQAFVKRIEFKKGKKEKKNVSISFSEILKREKENTYTKDRS